MDAAMASTEGSGLLLLGDDGSMWQTGNNQLDQKGIQGVVGEEGEGGMDLDH